MISIQRIICPSTSLEKKERINQIIMQINNWVYSDATSELISLFGGNEILCKQKNIVNQLYDLVIFSERWDYRKLQSEKILTKEKESPRWLLEDDLFIQQNCEDILKIAGKLGLIGINTPLYNDYDYIIVLGGARYANLHRCLTAEKVLQKNVKKGKIIALGAMRQISDSERYATDTYALNAKTEFDAMHGGIQQSFFKENIANYIEESHIDRNDNISWAIRKYEYSGANEIYLVAAPSGEPQRRANSADSYKFFFEKFNPAIGSKILFCTSSIYVPYQHVRFFEYAIKYNVQSDMIGISSSVDADKTLSKTVNYLQEIRAAIMAMYNFVSIFL